MACQLPATRLVTERQRSERSHRTDIDQIARQFGIDFFARKRRHFGTLPALHHPQFRATGDFLAETDAACTLDTAAHTLHRHQRSGILDQHHPLFLTVARSARPIRHRIILQTAFPALIAHRTIQRMIDKQELHHRLAGSCDLFGIGMHHHAIGHLRGTCRHQSGRFFDLDKAHPAAGRYRQLFVIAEMRDRLARIQRHFQKWSPFFRLYFFTVNLDFNHIA